MQVESKRKFHGDQAASTRRKAKKARLAEAQAHKVSTTPSKRDLRKAAKQSRPPKAITKKLSSQYESEDEDEDRVTLDNSEQESEGEGEEEEEEEEEVEDVNMERGEDSEDEEDEDVEEEDQEPIGKGKKGYRKKVKKPSGKKGKVFADTNAMLSIIDQVAGKEEERAKVKQVQMGKIKSKQSQKEQKIAEKEKAKKAIIDKKIEEIKRQKTEKRKELKHKSVEQSNKANAMANRKSVSFQV